MTDEVEKFCYALHPEEGYSGTFESREAALAEVIVSCGLEEGDEAWTAVIEPVEAEDIVKGLVYHRESILDDLTGAAMELVGQAAEDWPLNDSELPVAVQQQMDKELDALVAKWIREFLPYRFHAINDEQRHVVTKEDLE